MSERARVYVAGHRGLVGSALVRALGEDPSVELIVRERAVLDLRDARAVERFFADGRPQQVYLAAARVGGISANSRYPADFLRDNLQIQTNVIDSAWRHGVAKLCFLGSSCIYPRLAPQPIPETALLTGPLEPTNESYAIAKIAGIRMCQAYRRQYGFDAIALMPTNLYGPGDDFSLENSHVLPALIRRFDDALRSGTRRVVLWGTGTPRREFLHADDLASAAVHLMANYDAEEPINVGTGEDLTIAELAAIVAEVVGYHGAIEFDATRPDGTPRKLLDVTRLHACGWRHRTSLHEGIRRTYQWYAGHREQLRA
jgi:GDP-L-fucose synthase